MPTSLLKQCPQCGKQFQPRRKNQDYCTTECRTDFNNQVAKGRYATFKKEAPRVTGVQQELKKLKEYLATLTIIIEGVKEIDGKTITYQGRTYRYQEMADGFIGQGVSLSKGGAVLLPGGQIIYRTLHSSMVRYSGQYVLEK